MVLVARLVIVVLRVVAVLLQSPGFVVAFELHAFIDGEGRDSHPREAEVVGSVEVSGLGAGIWTDRQAEFDCGRLHCGIERRALSS